MTYDFVSLTHLDTIALASWSVITIIFIVVIGLVYRRFSKTKKNVAYTS